jgi:uncharacterized protein (DUF1778 family)
MRGAQPKTTKSKALRRTDFVLDAACRAAEEARLDRTVFTANAQTYRQFLARLDAPPKPNKRMPKSMQAPAPWE